METIDGKLYEELLAVTAKGADLEKESPLRAATASPNPYMVTEGTGTRGGPPLDSPSRPSNVTISSILRLSIQGHSVSRRRISMTDWLETPRTGGYVSPTERVQASDDNEDNNSNALLLTTGLPSTHLLANDESDLKANITTEEGRGALPLELFKLSLESPSVSRPSIELPPTLSRMPSAKKPSKISGSRFPSSQDSIFVAGTQFPPTHHDPRGGEREGALPLSEDDDDRQIRGRPMSMSLGTTSPAALDFMSVRATFVASKETTTTTIPSASSSPCTVEIPPTQWPAPTNTIDCSQAVDLFAPEAETSVIDGELTTGTDVLFLSSPPLRSLHGVPANVLHVVEGETARARTPIGKEDNPFLEGAPPKAPLAPIIIEEDIMTVAPPTRGSESRRRVQFADLTLLRSPSETDTPSVSAAGGGRTGRSLPETITCPTSGTGRVRNGNSRRRRLLSPPALLPARVAPSSSERENPESETLADLPITASVPSLTRRRRSQDLERAHQLVLLNEEFLPSDVSRSSGHWHRSPSQAAKGLPHHRPSSPTKVIVSTARTNVYESLWIHPSKESLAASGEAPQPSLTSSGSIATTRSSLDEHMLVWAKWRYQYYAPAILKSRPSRTRDLWRVRFAHWRGPRADEAPSAMAGARGGRTVCLAADQMTPLTGGLAEGQLIWIVRNRRKMQLTEGRFVQWKGPGRMQVNVREGPDGSCRGEVVDLQRILIDRLTFTQVRARGASVCPASSISSQMIEHEPDSGPEPELGPLSPQIPAPLSASKVSLGKRAHPKSRRNHRRNGGILKGYTFWISLGGGLSETAKRTQKSHLISRIKALGGTILEVTSKRHGRLASSPSPEKDHSRTILLVNGHYRLAKIYLALVLGIRIVRLEWLEACERSLSLPSLTAFAIPIPCDRPVDTSTRCRLLSSWQIAVEGSNKFKASWIPVCKAAGATIRSTYCDEGSMRVLVESLPSATSRLARFAKETGIIVVTVDWLMQSILTGRVF